MFEFLAERIRIFMATRKLKLQDMYDQYDTKDVIESIQSNQEIQDTAQEPVKKAKVSDYLIKYSELKEKHKEFIKYLTDEIKSLEQTVKDFKLNSNDRISVKLSAYKEILDKLQS